MKKMALETDFAKEFENFRKRFIELEENSKKYDMKCLMLEAEVENLKKKNEELEGQITVIQKVIDDRTTYGENDNEALYEMMVVNKVLECEKQKVESELCLWKDKFKELESNIKGMNEKVNVDIDMVSNCSKEDFHSQVRKRFPFEVVGCSNKKMALSTPGAAQSPFLGIIDIGDEYVSYNEIPKVKTVSGSRKPDDFAKSQCSSEGNIQKTNLENAHENHMNEFKFHSSDTRTAKRKRAAKIVTSDDENSYDDNAPICTLKTQHRSRVETSSNEEDDEFKQDVSWKSLTRLRRLESEEKTSFDLYKTFDSSEDEEDNDGVDEPDSEGESLGGFIVNSSDGVSKCDSESGDSIDESEDVLNEYKATLENIGRKNILNFKWDLEGDMLADLGKDPELCMRAVCALYRQQTADEKATKETIHHNERGFSQADAPRASKLAEFLTDGVPNGDLNKTLEELKEYDPKGIELCMRLAPKYSKQLFKIYQNKEDPYFMPP